MGAYTCPLFTATLPLFVVCGGCFQQQKRLRLSLKVDECEPLPMACMTSLRDNTFMRGMARSAGAYTPPLFGSSSAPFVGYAGWSMEFTAQVELIS